MKQYWRHYLLILILITTALYVTTRREAAIPAARSFQYFPQVVNDWQMVKETYFDSRVLKVLKPTDYLSRLYRHSSGATVDLYIGFHNGGPDSGPIHSPRQCLPGSGWNRLSDKVRSIQSNGIEISYVSSLYQKDIEKQLFLYWFQVGGDSVTNEYALKLAMVKNSLLQNRRDSAFIRISVMANDGQDKAIATGEKFLVDFRETILEMLPH